MNLLRSGYGKCHRKLKPPVSFDSGGRAIPGKPGGRPVLSRGAQVKGEKGGVRAHRPEWQHSGHGKPRVEQGQIGRGGPGPARMFRVAMRETATLG